MDYQLYENSDILLNDNSNSKNSWSMESNGELFGWNPLKINQEADVKGTRKRKLSAERITKQIDKDPLSLGVKKMAKRDNIRKGTNKMPHWQVDEYDDIENTLTISDDLVHHPYNVSETLLTINGMTVFKQEAPSPTSNDVTSLQVARQHRQSPTTTQHDNAVHNSAMEDNSQNMFNNTINQLLSQTTLGTLHNVVESNLSPPLPQDNYVVSSTNYNLLEDCRFQYVLAAATSIATKTNEDTLTYLNQGQSYEIKLKKLGDLSLYRGKLLKSVIRICFYERRLQFMEKEQMLSWQKSRPGDRILEVDVPLSYGAFDITQPSNALNMISFSWDPTKEVGVYIKVNCISTEFTPKKHGGEKGVPFRIQVETYQGSDNINSARRLHAGACQIKVFKLKGADRKHKQDREKIMKRPPSEQEKYQPSYECTVLNDLPNDIVLAPPPMSPVTTESSMDSNPQFQNSFIPGIEGKVGTVDDTKVRNVPEPLPERKTCNDNLEIHLGPTSTPDEIVQWLKKNRFDKYVETFERFSGDDMLRMSREDFIQICGDADGIRLHNAIHSKTIIPKLKIYVCRENSTVYNAIFLASHRNAELLQKLCALIGINQDQVRDVYIEGPHSIHVQLSDDVLKHINQETMFNLEVMKDNNSYIFLLKRGVK